MKRAKCSSRSSSWRVARWIPLLHTFVTWCSPSVGVISFWQQAKSALLSWIQSLKLSSIYPFKRISNAAEKKIWWIWFGGKRIWETGIFLSCTFRNTWDGDVYWPKMKAKWNRHIYTKFHVCTELYNILLFTNVKTCFSSSLDLNTI